MRHRGWKKRIARIDRLADIELRGRRSEENLQALRHVGDPLADAVIEDLRRTHPIRNPDDMLAIVRERAAAGPGVYRDFLEACDEIPDWVDFEAMRAGQRLIASAGPLMGISLLTGSLVGGSIYHKAAMVTALTGRLGMPGDISRRLVETAALVFHLSRPDEIRPGGQAHETLIRVRLLHGAIRQWMHDGGKWKARWDLPINQEDLAITMSQFSYLNVRSLLRMGVDLTEEEIDSHYLLWRYAGFVLGIREELLPVTFDEEIEQFLPMLKHQARPDIDLPGALMILDEIADKARLVPRAMSRKFLYQVTAYLCGDELVRGLGLRRERGYPGISLLRGFGRGWSLVHKRIPGGEAFLHDLGQRAFDEQLKVAARHRPIGYAVKTHHREDLERVHSRRMPRAAATA